MNETTQTVIPMEAVIEEMRAHGWHHARSQMIPHANLPGVPFGSTGPDVLAHLFVATTEVGAMLMGVILVEPDGKVKTFSLADGFNDTVDHCAQCVLRGMAVNTLTASTTHTLH